MPSRQLVLDARSKQLLGDYRIPSDCNLFENHLFLAPLAPILYPKKSSWQVL